MQFSAVFLSTLFAAGTLASPQVIDIPSSLVGQVESAIGTDTAAMAALGAAATNPAWSSAVAAIRTASDKPAALSSAIHVVQTAITGSDAPKISSALNQVISAATQISADPTAKPSNTVSSHNAAPTAGAGLVAGGVMAGAVAAVVMAL